MGRTLTATRTDAMTHPWGPGPGPGPGPESHTLSQSVLSNVRWLTQLWAAPEDVSVSVWGADGTRLVFTQQSSCKRFVYPGRCCSVCVIVPEWFTASALCWQQRGIQNTQQTRHCRLQAWSHHASSGLPGFRNKTRAIATLGCNIQVFFGMVPLVKLQSHFRG